MLKELFIDNFVIIQREHIIFENGFNVLSGETGSGKSLILDSINLLLGKRADKDAVGRFSDKTTLDGVFELDEKAIEKLTSKGIIFDDNLLIITRIISKKASSLRINSRIANLSLLREISDYLLDVYNQGDSSNFMNKNNYLNIIDSYGRDKESKDLRKDLKDLILDKRKLLENFEGLDLTEEEVQRELDLINYQIEDIEEIDLDNLNEEEIDQEYKKLTNIGQIRENFDRACEYISSSDYNQASIQSLISELSHDLNSYDDFDSYTKDFATRINAIEDEMDELYSDIDSYRQNLFGDPERLYNLEILNKKIFDLKRKYGNTIDEVKNYYEKIQKRKKELEDISEIRNNIEKEIAKLDKKLDENSKQLHEIRLRKAKELEEKIKEEIQSLNIVNGKFKIEFNKSLEINEKGYDDVDFLIRTNKGESLKSLSKTASGGEISRIILSFKKVFADFDDASAMVFDEIDQGISGRTAQIVGEKILDLSRKRQIIAISHLPQIASLSNNHILIKKYDLEDVTISEAVKIEGNQRVEEIARLIAGVDITKKTRDSAKEILEMAEELKNEQ